MEPPPASRTRTDHGFAEGSALALGLATVGLLGGILIGTVLVNRAVRSDKIHVAREDGVDPHEPSHELDRMDTAPVPEGMDPDPATSPLTVAVGAILLAILIGWVIQQALIGTEALISGKAAHDTFMSEIPLFPFTIVGGALLQLVITARGWSHLVPRALINQIAGLALDLLITAAIATLSLQAIGDNIGPFLLMLAVGFAWSIAAVYYIAPRFYGSRWFERAIATSASRAERSPRASSSSTWPTRPRAPERRRVTGTSSCCTSRSSAAASSPPSPSRSSRAWAPPPPASRRAS